MGKGDKKSKRGKIVLGTFGVRRHRKVIGKSMPAAPVREVEISESEPELKSAPAKRKTKTPTTH